MRQEIIWREKVKTRRCNDSEMNWMLWDWKKVVNRNNRKLRMKQLRGTLKEEQELIKDAEKMLRNWKDAAIKGCSKR